ncbi:hypothetical protein F183_A05450 [Bryobacterales bacterium F-183]|nr:hypothetical protein F183_A05450 [Bryobacterales bacterium F-183]
MSDHQPVVQAGNEGFDPTEVDAVTASIFGGVIILIIIAVFIGVTLFWDKFLVGRYRTVVEAAPNQQLEELHKSEAKALGGYSYVDKSKGQVRIPIDRAMQLLVEEVKAGKAPYSTKDAPKVADPADGAAAAAPAAAATPAPAH